MCSPLSPSMLPFQLFIRPYFAIYLQFIVHPTEPNEHELCMCNPSLSNVHSLITKTLKTNVNETSEDSCALK